MESGRGPRVRPSYASLTSPVSADGGLLAIGSHDNFIYLYTVSERGRKYGRYGKCSVRLLSAGR